MKDQLADLVDPMPDWEIVPQETALLDIDMQYGQHVEYPLATGARDKGLHRLYEYYSREITQIIPRVRRLKDAFREASLEVVHITIKCTTQDGREASPIIKDLGDEFGIDARTCVMPLGRSEGDLLDEVAKVGDEVWLHKTSGGAFNTSSLDQVLRNMGIRTLVVCGVVTNGCVESTLRGAADRGYKVFLVTDAVSGWTQKGHDDAIRIMTRWFARATTVDEIVAKVRQATATRRPKATAVAG